MSWLDDLPPGERAALSDAGRIGHGRFEGPEDHYARHEANPDMVLLIVERVGKVRFGGEAAVMRLPGEGGWWYSGEVEVTDGVRWARAVNGYAERSTAQYDAERRVRKNGEVTR